MMIRYVAATVGAPDLAAMAAAYKVFGYTVVEEGRVDPALAISWGAPRSSGRRFIVMRPATGEDVFVRAVEIDAVPNFKAATTLGWNSIEFVTDDPDKVQAQLEGSPIKVLGPPKALSNFPSIRAMQTLGPGQEVIHFTSDSRDPAESSLPAPPMGGGVGRIFIVVMAAPDVAAVNDWYASHFNMAKNAMRRDLVTVINNAQGLPADTRSDATVLRMTEKGNSVEFWGFVGAAAVPRPRPYEQLPPGVAIASMIARDLDSLRDIQWIRPPTKRDGLVYGGRRAGTFIGPVGELVELVEA